VNTAAGAVAGPVLPSARMEDLAAITDFVGDICTRARAGDEVTFALRLAVEEAFTNIVRHGYGGRSGPVRIESRLEPERITVTLIDEAPRFDPADAPEPDLESGVETRPFGGLGWHLVRQMMDEVRHEAGAERGNMVSLVKRLP
jgi:serine/threonine-protein kinase RsbW